MIINQPLPLSPPTLRHDTKKPVIAQHVNGHVICVSMGNTFVMYKSEVEICKCAVLLETAIEDSFTAVHH